MHRASIAPTVARVAHTLVVDRAALEELLTPRDDVVRERAVGDGRFEAVHGPFVSYERTVRSHGPVDGRFTVDEEITFRLAVPFWWFLFVQPFKRALAGRRGRSPWWLPPDRLDARAATVLGLLCSIAIVSGYLGTLITQTMTYVADEFGADKSTQSDTLAAVRVGALLALIAAASADRLGRRRMLLGSAVASVFLTLTGAVAPNLLWLGVSQTAARGMAAALLVLITIVSAEEMPPGARAYAYSLITMTGALGAGLCVQFQTFADVHESAWRALYVLPLLFLPVIYVVGRQLPESRRFEVTHVDVPIAGHGRRFALLAVSLFLLAVFAAPASQVTNDFLRDERGFSSARVTLFVILTSTPGAIGIIVGGRLAEVRGRRIVGAIGITGERS